MKTITALLMATLTFAAEATAPDLRQVQADYAKAILDALGDSDRLFKLSQEIIATQNQRDQHMQQMATARSRANEICRMAGTVLDTNQAALACLPKEPAAVPKK